MLLLKRNPLLFLITLLVFTPGYLFSQQKNMGIITGNLVDEKSKAVVSATVALMPYNDSMPGRSVTTDKDGNFTIGNIAFAWYRIKISSIGYQQLTLDSIHIRDERFDFNLNDIILKQATGELNEVVVYAEKPLIQSKDGNIIFNAGESALSAGSNAGELLKNVPLVTTDPNGKVLLRGKEPKILIDDKPVELNAQQLQDLLESLPGSSIEKIEVLTNPPPQYANEQGGVINIVTRKGRVGMGGRISLTAGSRGETTVSGTFTYRKNKLAINFNAGAGFNRYTGNSYSKRENRYTDSSNNFNTTSGYTNRSTRPNARLSIDYDLDKRNAFNALLQFNQNLFDNHSGNEYMNLNRFGAIYRLSQRDIRSEGENTNPAVNFTYTHRGLKPGAVLRIIAGASYSNNESNRHFFQQYMNADYTSNGIDSTQQQLNTSRNDGYSVRVSYDRPVFNDKTFLSVGSYYIGNNSHVVVRSSYLRKPDGIMVDNDLLSNDFVYRQDIINYRISGRQIIGEGFSVTAGTSLEQTNIGFDLTKGNNVTNNYRTWLPFANVNKTWREVLNLTFAYRRTIRRPGIGELNPTIDYGDPNNIRFGNPYLQPSLAHNFDLVAGRTKDKYYVNFGVGYNVVQGIYQQIRTLLTDGKTNITWDNISNRKEYEANTWSGYTLSRKLRLSLSATYSYNQYSEYDRRVNKYRNGGTFISNFSGTYSPIDVWNFTASCTYNRFANPQGTVRGTVSMNFAVQKRFFNRKLIVTVNAIDPFFQQKNNVFTYGSNFSVESFSSTKTRNFRLTLSYSLTKAPKKAKLSAQDKSKLNSLFPPKK
jgi:outer membrane receptor protein involved in Fe transport